MDRVLPERKFPVENFRNVPLRHKRNQILLILVGKYKRRLLIILILLFVLQVFMLWTWTRLQSMICLYPVRSVNIASRFLLCLFEFNPCLQVKLFYLCAVNTPSSLSYGWRCAHISVLIHSPLAIDLFGFGVLVCHFLRFNCFCYCRLRYSFKKSSNHTP